MHPYYLPRPYSDQFPTQYKVQQPLRHAGCRTPGGARTPFRGHKLTLCRLGLQWQRVQ
jgi:hypothetical protein